MDDDGRALDAIIERACKRAGINPEACSWAPGAYGSYDVRMEGHMSHHRATVTIRLHELERESLLTYRLEQLPRQISPADRGHRD
jgi:hypothetical protein